MALIVFSILQVSVQQFQVEGSSMSPTVNPGEYVAVNKVKYAKVDMARFSRLIPFWDASDRGVVYPFLSGGPQRGDVVVFRFPQNPERSFVKRVIGLPGERVTIAHGLTFIDGELLNEPYLDVRPRDETMAFPALGPDEYFVMGDNRRYSNDSRHWDGHFAVPLENIIGGKLLSYELPFDLWLSNPAD